MIFGSLDQAVAASRYLYGLHTRIQGELPESVGVFPQGSRYQANEVNALVWVYATLIESALVAYNLVLPPLSNHDREAYYAESKTLAALFGIPQQALPADWSAFEAYSRGMLTSGLLGVNGMAREMAHRVIHGRGSWVPVPQWYRSLTAAILPESLRAEFGLPYGTSQAEAAARAQIWLPRIYQRLPSAVRYVGPYQEAASRLLGRPPNAIVRASNRFWMGQAHTMFAEPQH